MRKRVKDLLNSRSLARAAAVAGGILSSGLVLAIVAILLFAWMAEEVLEGESAGFDTAIREFVHSFASAGITSVMNGLSFIGSTISLTAASVLLIAAFIYIKRYHWAIIFGAVMIGASILNIVLKMSFARIRPEPYFNTPLPASFSFPSGHALCSACFFCAAAWIFSSASDSRAAKIAAWSAAVIMAVLIGTSRIYLGVHYPTDVLAGYIAAFVWLLTVGLAESVVERRLARFRRPTD